MAIDSTFLASLRRQYRCEMLLVMVQLEQIVPGWWATLTDLADVLGADRTSLNKSLLRLDRYGLIRRHSASNCGGTWIWWVKRHETDAPRFEDEPAWVIRNVHNRSRHRIRVSNRREWAERRGIPYSTMRGFLGGHQSRLKGQWEVIQTPLDLEDQDCEEL